MGLDCRILPTSTRNLRQTKAEMRRELEELKWNMRNDPNHVHSTPSSNVGAHEDMQNANVYDQGPGTTSSAGSAVADAISPYENGLSKPATRKGSQGPGSSTLARALNGYLVDAKKIGDCFTLCIFLLFRPY